MNTLDCGEISCEYWTKDKCIYMTDNKAEIETQEKEDEE